jgi:hypothetical protein
MAREKMRESYIFISENFVTKSLVPFISEVSTVYTFLRTYDRILEFIVVM